MSVGWLATLRFSSSGVPLRMLMSAAWSVDLDCTALFFEPGMSTSLTCDRDDSVFGRLSSDPVPAAGVWPLPGSRPPRLCSPLFGSKPCASWVPCGRFSPPLPSNGTCGNVGMTFSSDRLATDVLASAIVSTHGPSDSLQRACAVPLSSPTLSNGFDGAFRPPLISFGLSGSAVCTRLPGVCGAWPPTASPNGDDCAIDFS